MTHDSSPRSDSDRLDSDRLVSRRSVAAAAAWTVPVVAVAVATPSAAASIVDIGAYALRGSCGTLGLLGPGFTLQAGPTAPLPIGTTVTITGSGIANIGVFSVSGGTATVNVLSGTSRQIVLTSEVPAGATIAIRTTLSITVAFQLNAVATLPTGYVGTGAKTAANVSSTLILCSAN
ncbi:hypothetical protein HQQ82_06960 [Rathayibacter sp. VKM Ac-2856]|uniref:hypothetical protein n=1 Tax=unclassified Rathayibacter TaxID=2609250 RepID=UPI001567A480|nr:MULTISPECIES: hypothetical protein [unclassified Rathayibacter]NQX04538.1 hypothetical protein [Rathayibacter sp. VKM Ac-2858]NQX19707.1 hypothetical protein [Rathayibacter sp. VKM Ac-2856]